MPSVSQTPTSTPQVSDYRQSWGKVEPWRTQASGQTTTTARPNETVTAPAQGTDRLTPVAPTAGPSEGSPTAAVPMVPLAPPAKRQLFSRLRGNNPPVQNVIPLEQVPAQVKEYGAPSAPVVVMPATEAPAGRRSLLSRPLFHGKQQVAQNGIPFDPSAQVITEGTPGAASPQPAGVPGAEGQPLVHTVDGSLPMAANPAPEKRGLLARIRNRRSGNPDDEPSPSRDGERERAGLFNRRRPNEIDADEPNAFSPPRKKEDRKDKREEERYANAFPVPTDKMPPQLGVNPMLPPLRQPQPPSQIPQAPFTSSQPRPQMPMAADAGLPSGMANAFTPGWTGRPLPADLDNRPQPTNGFGDGENMNSPPQVPQAAQMAGANAFPMANGGFPGGFPGGMMAAAAPRMPGYLPQADAGRQSVTSGYLPAPATPPSLQRAAYSATMAHMSLPASPNLPGQALSTPQMLIMLRESLYPSQREWAAEQLSHLDWHREQVVVASLVQGAREDPAPAVRAACVHALGAMKVNTLPVVQTVQGLQKDKDLRVRQEAAEALVAVGATAPGKTAGGDGVQRVGGSLPAE
jgi:hypothetical protein